MLFYSVISSCTLPSVVQSPLNYIDNSIWLIFWSMSDMSSVLSSYDENDLLGNGWGSGHTWGFTTCVWWVSCLRLDFLALWARIKTRGVHRHVAGLEKGARTEASGERGEVERAGAVQPGRRLLGGISSTCMNTWWVKEGGTSLFLVVLSDDMMDNGPGIQEITFKRNITLCSCRGGQTWEPGVQRGLGVSILGDSQHPTAGRVLRKPL